jgi:ribonuclease R
MSKRKTPKDPNLQREAERYEHPVPSREFILQHLEERGRPLELEALVRELGVKGDRDEEAFTRRLGAMVRDGQLLHNRRGEYAPVDKMSLVRGRVTGHHEGFGFLIPDDGGPDVYLSPFQMRRLLHGDRAIVRITGRDKRDRLEGAVVEVLERANREVVGRFFIEGAMAFVEPNNRRISQDILVPEQDYGGARHGQIVVVEITASPSRHKQPVGKVIEVLGDHMGPGMEIDIAIRAHDIPCKWPDAVEREITRYRDEVEESDKAGREDIRDLPLVTIDGEDARDFDDAVYCEPHGKGYRLLVAIADVSHYVRPGSALDEEAYERGNSVYFPDRVVPMLPEVLSNGLCSLNPNVDRLCMVCEMFVTHTGRLKSHRFFKGVMHSHARLTYSKVNAILTKGDKDLRKQYEHLLTPLENLYDLYHVMHKARDRRGAIDFDSMETRIIFGEDRKIDLILPVERNDAHKLIEECMILANIAAAEYLESNDMGCLYRIHEGPSSDKLSVLREFLGELGLTLGGGDEPQPKHYAMLLETVRERADAHLIETVMLRSLSQAVYAPDNVGHFGLALEAYAHFTSPIRRYPDLLVHRAIKHLLKNKQPASFRYKADKLSIMGEHCSMTDRRAEEATRDAEEWLKCEFMMDRVGEEFDGIITSVTGFGLFVELTDIFVEGLVHVTALPGDYYVHDQSHHRLVGERTRKIYRLADPVKVKVVRVDLDKSRIDFELADSEHKKAEKHPAGHPSKRGKSGKHAAKGKRGKTSKRGKRRKH